jgi:hypothetical protein
MDIVERLRARSAPNEWDIALGTEPNLDPLTEEAADEIERLRGLLAEAFAIHDRFDAALGQERG